MSDVSTLPGASRNVRNSFIRVAGAAGLLTQVLAIVINVILLAPPPDDPGSGRGRILRTEAIGLLYSECERSRAFRRDQFDFKTVIRPIFAAPVESL